MWNLKFHSRNVKKLTKFIDFCRVQGYAYIQWYGTLRYVRTKINIKET